MISQEKTTIRKLKKIETNLDEIRLKVGINNDAENGSEAKLSGFEVIQSLDFKREALLSQLNNSQFKSTNFFNKKDKLMGLSFVKQEKAQAFNRPTDLVTKNN